MAEAKLSEETDWKAHQLCIFCNGDCEDEAQDENAMVLCDCCVAVGAHLKCLKGHGHNISPEALDNPAFEWFCGEACERVSKGLVEASSQRRPLEKNGVFTSELVRYSKNFRASQNVVGSVVNLFKGAFGPSLYSDGTDLIELVCRGANHTIPTPKNETHEQKDEDETDQPPDCSNFLNFVLRKGGHLVAAAAVRAHGNLLAEVPYVVTKEGYRREGHCKRLVIALEGQLRELGVQWLAVPAVEATVPMWVGKLGFHEAGPKAVEQLEERIIVPEGSKILLKKVPLIAPPTKNTAAENNFPSSNKRVRFSLPSTTFDHVFDSEEEAEEDEEQDDDSSKSRVKRSKTSSHTKHKGKKTRTASRASKDSDGEDEYTLEASSDVEEEEEEGDCDGGCSRCGAHQAQTLHEDEDTGDMLCDKCHGAAALGTPAQYGNGAPDGTTACYHCKTTTAPHYLRHKETGGWECGTCRRYRQTHNGELRPARLFQRRTTRAVPAPTHGGATGLQTPTAMAYRAPQAMMTPGTVTPGAVSGGSGRLNPVRLAKSSLKLHQRLRTQCSKMIKLNTSSKAAVRIKGRMDSFLTAKALAAGTTQVAVSVVIAGGAAEAKDLANLRRQATEAEASKEAAQKLVAEEAAARIEAQAAAEAERQKREEAEAKLAALMRQLEEMEEMRKKEEMEEMRKKEEEACTKALDLKISAAQDLPPAADIPIQSVPQAMPSTAPPPPPQPQEEEPSQLEPSQLEPPCEGIQSIDQLIDDLGGNFSPEDDAMMPLKPLNHISSPSGQITSKDSGARKCLSSAPSPHAATENSPAVVRSDKKTTTRSPPAPPRRGNGANGPVSGLFSLFQGLSGLGGREGSGDTVMGDNSNLSGDDGDGEVDGSDSEMDGDEGLSGGGRGRIDPGMGAASMGRMEDHQSDSLMNAMNGPEALCSQGSQAEGVVQQKK